MGSFLLTRFASANADALPRFMDMDGALQDEDGAPGGVLPRAYFCRLTWGPRYGLCDGHSHIVQTCAGRRIAAGEHIGLREADDCGQAVASALRIVSWNESHNMTI